MNLYTNKGDKVSVEKVYLSVDDAALYLCLSKPTLYDMVHQRKIPFRKHGSRLIFCKADLDTWSDANKFGELSTPVSIASKVYYKAEVEPEQAKCSLKTEQEFAEAATPKKGGGCGYIKK